MATKIEGHTTEANVSGASGIWLFTDRVTANKATLVIHGEKHERVFTQSEVRAMADEVIDAAKEECNTVYRSDEEAEAEMSAMLGRIFARHGLSDPA